VFTEEDHVVINFYVKIKARRSGKEFLLKIGKLAFGTNF